MKNILVPCDFSTQSNEAFQMALNVASKSKGQITLLHALATPSLDSEFGEPLILNPKVYTAIEEEAKRRLDKMKAHATAKSVKTSTEVVYGDLVPCIKEQIESKGIDLIIMGTSGSSGFSEMFIGSNTEKVVRFSTVPVLAVRKSFALESVKHILLPSALELNQTKFMKSLQQLQDFFEATLHILYVNTPIHFKSAAEGNELLQDFVEHYKLKNFKTHFQNYAREEQGIIDFAKSEKMDIVAMATHARKGLAHVFNISITEDVVNHIEIPIWTFCIKS